MAHPKLIGDRTTLAVMLTLHELGYAVSVPFGENTRYDLVLDRGDRLERVQCKTGRLRGGAVVFNTASTYMHHPSSGGRRTYAGEIEHFGVYCAETAGIYLVPIADVNCSTTARLRVVTSRNGQRKGIRLASEYQIGEVEVPRVVVTPTPRASSGARGSSA